MFKCSAPGCEFESEDLDEFTRVCPRCLGYGLPVPECTCEYKNIPGTEVKTGFIFHLNPECSKHRVLPLKPVVLVDNG